MKTKSVVVVGAGPAGMMAAGQAASLGARTVLLEGTSRPGRKLLMTGGGRCNISNTAPLPEWIRRFGREGRFLHHAFSRFFVPELCAFFQDKGLPLRPDPQGRVYPETEQAPDVLSSLLQWIRACGVSLVVNTEVSGILRDGGRVTGVTVGPASRSRKGRPANRRGPTRTETYRADAVVIAAGGASYPATGSRGLGYLLAESVGHRVVPVRPALVPLVASDPICRELQGLSLQDVGVKARIGGKIIGSVRDDVVFTHFGVSGPAILSLSGSVVDALSRGATVEMSLDLLPELRDRDLRERLRGEARDRGKRLLRNTICTWLPERMAAACLQRVRIPADRRGNECSKIETDQLVRVVKDLRIPIEGARPLKEAMVTAGGVDLGEIDPTTMMSRRVEGLFFAGEVLDLQGDTGGFNLQAAFSTGWLAGVSAGLWDG